MRRSASMSGKPLLIVTERCRAKLIRSCMGTDWKNLKNSGVFLLLPLLINDAEYLFNSGDARPRFR